MAENETIEVRRSIEIAADPDEVWRTVIDDDERSQWWGGPSELTPDAGSSAAFTDPDGTTRRGIVDAVEPGRHLAWTWWDERGDASRVTIDVSPSPAGTRLDVVETLLRPTASAQGEFRAGLCAGATVVGRAAHCRHDELSWIGSRLLELERLFLLRSTNALVA